MASLDYYKKQLTESNKSALEKALKDVDDLANEQKKSVNETYDGEISDVSRVYDDSLRDNAVQKLINERRIAENMENLGLTDSGLNRTQTTAVQLGYANNKSAIGRQRQQQIDTYNRDRAQKISTIEQQRISGRGSVNDSFNKNIEDTAYKLYKADVDAETERRKSYYSYLSKQQDAKPTGIINSKNGILSRNYTGSLSENGVSVSYDRINGKTTYIDRITGYQSTFDINVNPYTNTVNSDTKYGTFSNGYQPDNVGKNKPLTLEDSKAFNVNGQLQNVFKNGDKYYVWDGANNEYFEVKKQWINNNQYKWEEA